MFNRKQILFVAIFIAHFCVNAISQTPYGVWMGTIRHGACTGARTTMTVRLQLDSNNNKNNTIKYYPGYFSNNNPEDDFTVWAFNTKCNIDGQLVRLSYSARDEIWGRRNNYGYYIAGGYRIAMTYSNNNGIEKLVGAYTGSNGGRGSIFFTRGGTKQSPDSISNNSSSSSNLQNNTQEEIQNNINTIAALRAKMIERKNATALQQSKLTTNSTVLDTAKFFNEPYAIEDISLENISKQHVMTRKSKVQDSIIVLDSSFIDIQMYDAAEIDNDTISLYADSQLILHRVKLNANPLKVRISRPEKGNKIQLKMVAENLGSIPPNTAVLTAVVRRKQYQINVESDFNKNGTVLLIWY